jgi:hypothetical protein
MKTIPAKDADALNCPVCEESSDIRFDTRSNNQTLAELNACKKCGCRWMNIFKMREQVILEPGEEFPVDIEDD